MASALALRDFLCAATAEAFVLTADRRKVAPFELVEPEGDTCLAGALVDLVRSGPDAVFVITDGYENAPAGRTDEVVHALRRLGVSTPIFQLSSVFAAESHSVRALGDRVPAMPVSGPESLGLALLRAAIEADPERGVRVLLGMAGLVLEMTGAERPLEGRQDSLQLSSEKER
jgi:hypothetical protein